MSNLLLSLELLSLMGWLLKNEKTRMNGLIKKAIDNGLGSELIKIDKSTELNDNLRSTFVDFISYLENTLLDGLDDIEPESDILSSLNINNIDLDTLLLSAQEAEVEILKNKSNDKKEVLLEKILDNWKPDNSEIN